MPSHLEVFTRIVHLAHERELIVLPVAITIAIAGIVYLALELRRRLIRWRHEAEVIRVAVVAPWLRPEQLRDLVDATAGELRRAGSVVSVVPSALQAAQTLRPASLEPALTADEAGDSEIRTDELVGADF